MFIAQHNVITVQQPPAYVQSVNPSASGNRRISFQVQTQITLFREGLSLTSDVGFCQGTLVTTCAVLRRHRNCRIIVINTIQYNICLFDEMIVSQLT